MRIWPSGTKQQLPAMSAPERLTQHTYMHYSKAWHVTAANTPGHLHAFAMRRCPAALHAPVRHHIGAVATDNQASMGSKRACTPQ